MRGWIVVLAVLCIFICAAFGVLSAAKSVLGNSGDDPYAYSGQRASSNCIGFVNIGSCNTEQESTVTASRSGGSSSGYDQSWVPWVAIGLLLGVIVGTVYLILSSRG